MIFNEHSAFNDLIILRDHRIDIQYTSKKTDIYLFVNN